MQEVNLDDLNLTEKQKIFCREYIFDWNATRAAIAAGYSEKTATLIGCENLTKPNIQTYIKSIQNNLEEVAGISRLKVLQEYQKIAFSSIAHLHNTWVDLKDFDSLTDEQKACIESIQTKKITRKVAGVQNNTTEETEYVLIKLFSKEKALENICKMLGYNETEKRDMNSTPSISININKEGNRLPNSEADVS